MVTAMQETQVQSLVRKIPWNRKWQPTPVFLPGESHGQKSLAGHSPWGHKEWDTTERLLLSLSFEVVMEEELIWLVFPVT